jgi:hypothetical protein
MDTAPAPSPSAEAPPSGEAAALPAASRKKKRGTKKQPSTKAPVPAKETRSQEEASADETRIQPKQPVALPAPTGGTSLPSSSLAEPPTVTTAQQKEAQERVSTYQQIYTVAAAMQLSAEGERLLSQLQTLTDSYAAKAAACLRVE